MPAANFDFYLTDLSFAMGLGQLATISTGEDLSGVLMYDATAELYVSLQAMKSTFQIAITDSCMNDLSGCNYYVIRNNAALYPGDTLGKPFPSVAELNVANAVVKYADAVGTIDAQGATYTYDEQQIQDDFIRHLAQGVFGTHFGTAIFNNVTDLCNNIVNLCADVVAGDVKHGITYDTSGVYTMITDALKWVDSANTYSNPAMVADAQSGLYYLPNTSEMDNKNLTREIMEQIFKSSIIRNRLDVNTDPSGNGLLVDSPLPQPVPFIENDTLCMAVTFTPAAGQVNISNNTVVGPRRYLVKFVLKDDDAVPAWTPLYKNTNAQTA